MVTLQISVEVVLVNNLIKLNYVLYIAYTDYSNTNNPSGNIKELRDLIEFNTVS